MISLKKLMSETGQIPAAETWHRALSLLVQGIALHAVVFDEAQHDKFREELDQLSTAISPQSPPGGVMRTVGALNKRLEEYNRRAAEDGRSRQVNLRQIIGMLSRTIAGVAKGNSCVASQIAEIEHELDRTKSLEEFQRLKASLEKNLRRWRADCERQAELSNAALQQIMKQLEHVPARSEEVGKPAGSREEAESAIRAVCESGERAYFAACVPESMSAITRRFGPQAGAKVVLFLAQLVNSRAKPTDSLFRWSSNCLVVLMKRLEPAELVKLEAAALFGGRLETTLQLPGHEVLLPIRVAWVMLPSVEFESPEAIARKLSAFENAAVRST
ncbi:MAG: hypothetical protein IT165_33840 [Bryobacterales bacterium]|nr:hypothetical protein [Bryobacterales bacterium]